MLSFFRLNDPFRIIAILFILVLLKLPMLTSGSPLTLLELNWMLVGERLAEGHVIYDQLFDNTGPLAAFVYWLIDITFGKSLLAYHIIAIVLITYQAFYFNLALIDIKMFNEKTYVPALMYVLFACTTFEMLTLSPALMSLSFLILVLRNVIKLDSQSGEQEIFKTGLYTGIATFFYMPSFLYLLAAVLGFALFRTSSVRLLLNVVAGYVFVWIIMLLYFMYQNNLIGFYRCYVQSFFLSKTWMYSLKNTLVLFSFPAVLLLVSIFKLKTSRGFINYQQNGQWFVVLWTIFTLVVLIISPKFSGIQFIIFAPVFSFFVSHYLLLIRKNLIAEIQFIAISAILVGIGYSMYFNIDDEKNDAFYEKILPVNDKLAENKRIMVLGNNISAYNHNSIATPFLNWKISQNYLGELNEYPVIVNLKNSILEDKPDMIVDYTEDNLSEKIFDRIPLLFESYEFKKEGSISTYTLLPQKNNSTVQAQN
ncbi:hypothetical protein [Chondrinema litorale]|uniref:hypothetical protein n=1 Tax=Chondrinema litorale TaxID=2994555 RepID=UPI002542A373|nr:hypothetical protein [Chondrinema litorale]UZR93322.1 hypothetical protein OQ292_15805 [Chondrinema litorale]